MWIFTNYGFFSAVKDNSDNSIKLRARRRGDIENLQAHLPQLAKHKIHCYKEADYRYRIIISRNELAEIMLLFADNLNYENFKDHIYKTPDQRDKVNSYGKIWEVMWNYQEAEG